MESDALSTEVLVLGAARTSVAVTAVSDAPIAFVSLTEGLAGAICDAEAPGGSTAESLSASAIPVAAIDCSAFAEELDAFKTLVEDD